MEAMRSFVLIMMVAFGAASFGQAPYQYFDNGQVKKEYVMMSKGNIQVNDYFEDGTLSQAGFFVDGKPNGIWNSFYPDGAMAVRAQYNNGLKDGIWYFWSLNGEEMKEVHYSNNEIIGVIDWSRTERRVAKD
jgi:antitoxin component YwqK of YwqJK toxin-antitoxin module